MFKPSPRPAFAEAASRRQVETGGQTIRKTPKTLDSGACPGLDPGFAGMTRKGPESIFFTALGG